MADPYGSSESEDISSFLQIFLHNSSSASIKDSAASSPAGGLFCVGQAPAPSVQCSSGTNFYDPMSYMAKETDESYPSASIKHLVSSFEESEGSEFRIDSAPPRSSKRSRAAEVHNLSEKRRRSRINEKLKALQSLVPNSNKTDKASMLDEAIEYLKQLQLQVQMLTMRNGMSLDPGYTLGSTLMGPHKQDLVNGNSYPDSNIESSLSRDIMQNTMETVNHGYSTQEILAPSITNNTSDPGFLPSIVPSFENHYGYFTHLAPTEGICEDDTLSRLQLGATCSRDNLSPSREVSSELKGL